jgi:ACS family hexuronate transporter-like MFS transporter
MSLAKGVTAPARQSYIRWGIWALLVAGTMINFGDRAVLGVVAPFLMKTLHLTIQEYGVAASAFSWGYVPLQLIAGIIVAHWGARKTWTTAMILWSCFIVLTPLAPTFGVLLLVRLLFGITEGSNFPSAGTIVGAWFPAGERNFGLSPNGIGEAIGNIAFIPLTAALATAFSWRVPFFVVGALGLVWVLLALRYLTNRPSDNPLISQTELRYIEEGRVSERHPTQVGWGRILTTPMVWAGAVGLFSTAYLIYLALSFAPLYFSKEYGLPTTALAGITIWPWVASGIGAMLGGRLSDMVYRRTRRLKMARGVVGGVTLIVMALALVMLTVIGPHPGLAVAIISIAMFLQGFANIIFFIVPVDVSPNEPARTSGFIVGFASASGLVAPIVTATTVARTGSFNAAFLVAAGVAFVGAILSLTLIRDRDVFREETPVGANV